MVRSVARAVALASARTVASMNSTRICRARWARNSTSVTTLASARTKASVTEICGTNEGALPTWSPVTPAPVLSVLPLRTERSTDSE